MTRHYKKLSISVSFEAAAKPLSIAPSTFGLTQKSPQMANFFFLSQRHFSSLAMLAAGKALPLGTQPAVEIMKLFLIEWKDKKNRRYLAGKSEKKKMKQYI